MTDARRRTIANTTGILADAMNTIPGDVVQTHRLLGQVDHHDDDRDRTHRDGEGMWCWEHERSLTACKAAELDCRGETVYVSDPTGDAAVASSGSSLAALRRQGEHDAWLQRLIAVVDEGLNRWGYGRARVATSTGERLLDATGCPIDCCPHCWTHVARSGKHWEKSIEGDHNAGLCSDGRRVCGPCREYENDYGHLPPEKILGVMRNTKRRPVPTVVWRLDPAARRGA